MPIQETVSREDWLAARLKLLEQEKALTRQRDEVARARRSLPRVLIDRDYEFQSEAGPQSLADLFEERSQLIVYHFMFGPDWEEGCQSCSLIADGFDGIRVHLANRDATLLAVSRGPLEKLLAFRRRLGWHFKWVSSLGSDFNDDFHVGFSEADQGGKIYYNYGMMDFMMSEMPGISVFQKDPDGTIYHTYSCFARGLDALLNTYQYLDLVPKGRDEDELNFTMEWVRHNDRYET